MLKQAWALLRRAGGDFMADNALSRGAAIAYYTIFSIGPVLLIVVAIIGLVYGREAAQGAIVGQLSGMMGQQSAEAVQSMIQSADRTGRSGLATVIGIVTLLITASGVFSEMQSSLNAIWKAEPHHGTITRMMRARAASLGLVATLGFLLLVSLAISAAVHAIDQYFGDLLPGFHWVLLLASFAFSFLLVSVMFGAIYKILPDKNIEWRDVRIGAIATAFLFSIGKFLIGLYIGRAGVASSYGAAGSLLVILVWIYYSAQIFLFGAEFTKAYAETHGSHARDTLGDEAAGQAASVPPPTPVGHAELDRLRQDLHENTTG